jgi:16S rRNA (adenine1518-N6/adenine1519-N6)-dimethyltransferase
MFVADPRHLSPSAALRAMDRRPNRRLSQSFLRDVSVARSMVAAADLRPDDTALEIGPGLGILTRELLLAARQVVAIEVDQTLATALPGALGNPANLQVVRADALAVSLSEVIGEPYITVASLPYHVANPILFKLLFNPPRPTRIVAMVQLEVANRLVGRPGALTYLGAAVSLVADARIVRRVAPGSFFPAPKVSSAVVRLDLLSSLRVEVDSASSFLEMLRAGFAQPRKQLHNSLAQGLGVPPEQAAGAIRRAELDPSRRPGDLTLAEWALVYQCTRGVVRGDG